MAQHPFVIALCAVIVLSAVGVFSAQPPDRRVASEITGRDLLIRNVRIVGGDAALTDIAIRGGIIEAIGPDRVVESRTERERTLLEAGGAWVMPGLIDSHVHLGVVPGSGQRKDSEPQRLQLQRQHLRAYLASGVTTVVDMGSTPENVRQIRGWLDAGEPGPQYLSVGPGFLTPGGYLTDMYPIESIRTFEDVESHFAVLDRLGVVGVKVPLEKGFGPDEVWPILGPEIRQAISAGARKRGLPIFVHGTAEDEQVLGLEMGATALVHIGFADSEPSDAFIERVVSSGTFMMTTFGIMDAALIEFDPSRLDDALFARVVPEEEIATARNPASGVFLRRAWIRMGMAGAPEFLVKLLTWLFMDEASIRGMNESTIAAAVRLHDAGAKLVIGSDSGNWDIVPYQFHGPTTIRELELLADAGVPAPAVLNAATSVPAEMLGLEEQIGAIRVGMRADLIVAASNPSENIRALRELRWVVKSGEARTPDEWMEEAPATRARTRAALQIRMRSQAPEPKRHTTNTANRKM